MTKNAIKDVVLMVADEWRADILSQLGTPGVRTPNLDRLASRGVTFTNHWCDASPCGPSRQSLHTGASLFTHGQWSNYDRPHQHLKTLASVVRDAGIAPLLVGYTDTPSRSLKADFSAVDLYDPAFEVVRPFFWQLDFPEYRAFLGERGFTNLAGGMAGIYPVGTSDPTRLANSMVRAEDSDVAWLTDAAISALEQARAPTLLHLNWLRPHPPIVPVEPYAQEIDPAGVALPTHPARRGARAAMHPFFALASERQSMREYVQRDVPVEALRAHDERQLRAGYYALCREVDHHIGRVLETLERTGHIDTTLIIFTSDHGDALGDHGLYGRRGPFDGHFKVPCIVVDPRSCADDSRGTRNDRFTANIDVMPTILEALGLDAPSSVEGQSMLASVAGRRVHDRAYTTFAMDWSDHAGERAANGPQRFRAVRTAQHLYVEFNRFEPLLFNLAKDPHALEDLSAAPGSAHLRSELAALLPERW